MKKLVLGLAFILAALPARAETLPPAALDKEYQACLSGPSNGLPQQKQQYCLCVRNKMATWDISVYVHIAQEMAARGSNSIPPELDAVAKECIAIVTK